MELKLEAKNAVEKRLLEQFIERRVAQLKEAK